MQFLVPAMFGVLGLIPVLILIHLFKPKPKQIEVTNLFLWQDVLKDRGGSVTLKRLVHTLILWLQILLVILTALALARPVWTSILPQKGDVILVIDSSASMKGIVDAGKTRFDLAKERALELLDSLERTQQVLVIEAGSQPLLVSGFSRQFSQIKDLIEGLKASDAPGTLEEAVYLALSFVSPEKQDRVHLISDGAGQDMQTLVNMHPAIEADLISGGERNVGITKFEFRRDFSRPDSYEIMVEVKNFSDTPAEAPLRLSVDKFTIEERSLTLEAGEKRTLFLPYSRLITGIARAEIDIDDDFETDNAAYLSLSESKDIWILLVSTGNYFLERLLESYPNVLLNRMETIDPNVWQEQVLRHDLVIIDRVDFPEIAEGNFLIFDAYSSTLSAQKIGETTFPRGIIWNAKDPLMQGVNLMGLNIEQASLLETPPRFEPVLESADGALMYRYEDENLRIALLTFDITRSDLPVKIAFPVMMSNIINWLTPNKLDFSTSDIRAGEVYPIHLAPDSTEVSVRAPGDRWKKIEVSDNPFLFTDTLRVGVYTLSEDKKDRYFTVNLLDERESDLRGPVLHELPDTSAADLRQQAPVSTQRALWMLFLLPALFVLMLEWHVWLKNG